MDVLDLRDMDFINFQMNYDLCREAYTFVDALSLIRSEESSIHFYYDTLPPVLEIRSVPITQAIIREQGGNSPGSDLKLVAHFRNQLHNGKLQEDEGRLQRSHVEITYRARKDVMLSHISRGEREVGVRWFGPDAYVSMSFS